MKRFILALNLLMETWYVERKAKHHHLIQEQVIWNETDAARLFDYEVHTES